ncbi:WD40-repeat-containing domain protein [Mycena floridula]|nr:WD40-repeat-containing domain protein [Mycena floridula]
MSAMSRLSSFRSAFSSVTSRSAEASHPSPNQIADLSIRKAKIHTVEGDLNSNNNFNSNNTSNSNNTFIDNSVNITTAQDADEVEARKLKETIEALDKMLEPSLALHARLVRHSKLQVCYPGTREDILQEILSWIRSESESDILRRCICVVGVPGSGKSTIAATVVESLEVLKSLGILSTEFFIRRGVAEDPNQIFPTIAQQLSRLSSEMAHVIHQSLSQKPLLVRHLNHAQIDKLFLAPLGAISQTVVIVIDALDELTEPAHIARFIAYIIPKLPSHVRLLLTTRNEHDILVHLEQMITKISLELRVHDSVDDVKRYITEKLRDNLRLKFMDDEDWRDWPSPEQIQALSNHASGLFVWGATAVGHITQFVYDEGISGRDEVLAEVNSIGMYDLDALYGFILQRLLPKSNSSAKLEHIRRIIGFLVVAQVPMNLGEVCVFLSITPRQFDAKHFLQRARSILLPGMGRVDENANPQMHKSFVDFITSPRAKEFQIHEPYHHGQALRCALKSMQTLHFNMCNLESSYLANEEVEDLEQRVLHIPAHVRYSCYHWSHHLLFMGTEKVALLPELEDFMKNRFLFWLEVLSLSGSFFIAAQSMKRLAGYLEDQDEGLERFVQDATKFIASNAPCIAHSAPHLYLSALPLSPSSSVVANHYRKQYPNTLSVAKGRKAGWDAELVVIKAHTRAVGRVAFSPDGNWIASGSRSGEIAIWDAETGGLLVRLRQGYGSKAVTSLEFSADGKRLVSATWHEYTVQVWDAQTGNRVRHPFEGHHRKVNSAAFSPVDGNRIVSGSDDRTVIVWDATTGKVIAGPLEGHEKAITSVVFSPDGSHVISVSCDNAVWIWNADSGEIVVGPLQGPLMRENEWYYDTESPVLSRDGKYAASRDGFGALQVWDTKTGRIIQQFTSKEEHNSVAFSYDGQYLVTSTRNRLVTCGLQHGVMNQGPYYGSRPEAEARSQAYAVTFSPDGQRVVAGIEDGVIRIWDRYGISPEYKGSFSTAALSPDGKVIASGSNDGVRTWDTETGNLLAGPFKTDMTVVLSESLAFSPKNGNHLVSGSVDGFILIWDIETEETVLGPLEGHNAAVFTVAFSPDGLQIASGSQNTIRIWNAEMGECLLVLQNAGPVLSVAFSPDGHYLASGPINSAVYIWDVKTGEVIGLLRNSDSEEGDSSTTSLTRSQTLVFSPDGNRIVSGSDDEIQIWDVKSCALVLRFREYTVWISSVDWSPDGKWVIWGSSWHDTVHIWDAENGNTVAILQGHTKGVNHVSLSLDGTRLVSSSSDTLRIWDFSRIIDRLRILEQADSGDEEIPIIHEDTSEMIDGWIMTRVDGLLFWVPPVYRAHLWQPSNIAVIGPDALRLDFSKFVHGRNWTRCRDPFSSS